MGFAVGLIFVMFVGAFGEATGGHDGVHNQQGDNGTFAAKE